MWFDAGSPCKYDSTYMVVLRVALSATLHSQGQLLMRESRPTASGLLRTKTVVVLAWAVFASGLLAILFLARLDACLSRARPTDPLLWPGWFVPALGAWFGMLVLPAWAHVSVYFWEVKLRGKVGKHEAEIGSALNGRVPDARTPEAKAPEG